MGRQFPNSSNRPPAGNGSSRPVRNVVAAVAQKPLPRRYRSRGSGGGVGKRRIVGHQPESSASTFHLAKSMARTVSSTMGSVYVFPVRLSTTSGYLRHQCFLLLNHRSVPCPAMPACAATLRALRDLTGRTIMPTRRPHWVPTYRRIPHCCCRTEPKCRKLSKCDVKPTPCSDYNNLPIRETGTS